MSQSTVHLVVSFATLLSGGLKDCSGPDDETCRGGVAAVGAMLRNYSQGEPSLVVPFADRQSPFVQMHPLAWSVNRLVLSFIMGWNVYVSPPSILQQNRADYEVSQQDLSDMQSTDMPLLLTNVNIPPSSSWFRYTQPVFFDEKTVLAVLSVINSNQPLSYSQVESTIGTLNMVARMNAENGCGNTEPTLFERFTNTTVAKSGKCWVPVVLYADVASQFMTFLEGVLQHTNPPALIVDLERNADSYLIPRRIGSQGTWLVSYFGRDRDYLHHRIIFTPDHRGIERVEMIFDDIRVLDSSLKDEQYVRHIMELRRQADEANVNDPVVGLSTFMPVARDGSYRRCKAGECEIGNLFADAALWWADADFAFTTSGGLRGSGWAAGDVRTSNIWDALPFPNTMCAGVMNGVSLFKLFNYSINEATFEGENTDNGDRLLQVAGIRVTYNLQLQGQRLVRMEVWDKQKKLYEPVQRLNLYKFVTDSFSCAGFDPFPTLLRTNLTSPGEEPGKILDGDIHQNIVADYLRQLGGIYQAGIKGRLVNDTSIEIPLNLIQTAEDCDPGTFWREEFMTCESCPDRYNVAFLRENVAFQGVTGIGEYATGHVELVNTELFDVVVVPKSRPSWLNFSVAELDISNASIPLIDGLPTLLQSGERMSVGLTVSPGLLEPGTAQGTVSFGVLNGGEFVGCSGQDASFEVIMRVLPEPDLNYLGGIRYVGWTTSALAVFASLFFTVWVQWNRKLRIVTTLQPFFLVMISFGVLVVSLSIVTMSIDDEIASQSINDIACMATPWLLSMGFSIAMSALFVKLWRINKLFQISALRRIKVEEKDVMGPFALLFAMNFVILLVWTIAEPLRFFRIEVSEGESWNTVGTCQSSLEGNGSVSITMLALSIFVNASALACACYQAYVARNISDEFSESKNMGVALFSWLQLLIVGFPVLFLIDDDNPKARYFLRVLLVFALSMSMLLLIFVPLLLQAYVIKQDDDGMDLNMAVRSSHSYTVRNLGTTRVSGLNNKFGVQNFEQIQKELDKLSYHERAFSDCDDNSVHRGHSLNSDGVTSIQGVGFPLESLIECSDEFNDSGNINYNPVRHAIFDPVLEPTAEVTECYSESDVRISSFSVEDQNSHDDSNTMATELCRKGEILGSGVDYCDIEAANMLTNAGEARSDHGQEYQNNHRSQKLDLQDIRPDSHKGTGDLLDDDKSSVTSESSESPKVLPVDDRFQVTTKVPKQHAIPRHDERDSTSMNGQQDGDRNPHVMSGTPISPDRDDQDAHRRMQLRDKKRELEERVSTFIRERISF